MYKYFLFLLLCCITFGNISNAETGDTIANYSSEISNYQIKDNDIKISEITGNSVNIEWPKTTGYSNITIYYDTLSHDLDNKYISTSDIINGTGVLLNNLTPNTTYYFKIFAFDKDANNIPISKELEFTTISSEITNTKTNSTVIAELQIKNINVTNPNKLEIYFSSNLDKTSLDLKQFKIISDDNNSIINVSEIELSDNKINATLSKDLEVSQKYIFSVNTVKDVIGNIGNNLKYSFNTPETFSSAINNNLDNGNITPITNNIKSSNVFTGDKINTDNIKRLPKTGPELYLIVSLALIISTVLILLGKKKLKQ